MLVILDGTLCVPFLLLNELLLCVLLFQKLLVILLLLLELFRRYLLPGTIGYLLLDHLEQQFYALVLEAVGNSGIAVGTVLAILLFQQLLAILSEQILDIRNILAIQQCN